MSAIGFLHFSIILHNIKSLTHNCYYFLDLSLYKVNIFINNIFGHVVNSYKKLILKICH